MPTVRCKDEQKQICGAANLLLYIHFRVGRAVQEIVNGNSVEFRQLDKSRGGNIDIASLVVAVDPLATGENLPHLGLGQVFVLSEIPNPGIQWHNKYTPMQ